MRQFDIYITYVSWGDSGKTRPVLSLDPRESVVAVFNITTQYEGKSDAIRAGYFTINDWKQAGLERQSYIDTNTVWDMPTALFDGKKEIGKLTAADETRLIEFLSQ
jgi:hypothetical protein